jgi:hypothetical protein
LLIFEDSARTTAAIRVDATLCGGVSQTAVAGEATVGEFAIPIAAGTLAVAATLAGKAI